MSNCQPCTASASNKPESATHRHAKHRLHPPTRPTSLDSSTQAANGSPKPGGKIRQPNANLLGQGMEANTRQPAHSPQYAQPSKTTTGNCNASSDATNQALTPPGRHDTDRHMPTLPTATKTPGALTATCTCGGEWPVPAIKAEREANAMGTANHRHTSRCSQTNSTITAKSHATLIVQWLQQRQVAPRRQTSRTSMPST